MNFRRPASGITRGSRFNSRHNSFLKPSPIVRENEPGLQTVVRVEEIDGGAILHMACGHTCSTGDVRNRLNTMIPCLTCEGGQAR